MEKIEDLKRKAKELEYNKKQLETQIQKITEEIELLKSQRYYLNAFEYIANIPSCFDEPTVKRMKDNGNYFETIEEAEKEIKKRELKRAVEEFRNECNGDWQPNWKDELEEKWSIMVKQNNRVEPFLNYFSNHYPKFGYFKRHTDSEKAIKLFGDRILELYVG